MRAFLPLLPAFQRINLEGSLCFFGFGELMRLCFDQLALACGRQPDIICDNDPQTWGQSYRGVPIVSPDRLNHDFGQNVCVVITIRQYESVYNQLLTRRIPNVLVADYERALFRVSALSRVFAVESEAIVDAHEDWISAKLDGRWALVTGAARGLGAEIARALACHGVNLLLHGRDYQSLSDTLAACLTQGVRAKTITADFSDTEAVEAMGQALANQEQRIDFLINNAAISPPIDEPNLPSPSTALFEKCFRVNTLAPIILIKSIIPQMLKYQQGTELNLTSSIRGDPSATHYSCSKAALDKYLIDIYESLNGTGVSITAIDPGWLKTPMTSLKGLYEPSTVINGVILSLVLNLNGRWVSAQDYSGMALNCAIEKARQLYRDCTFH